MIIYSTSEVFETLRVRLHEEEIEEVREFVSLGSNSLEGEGGGILMKVRDNLVKGMRVMAGLGYVRESRCQTGIDEGRRGFQRHIVLNRE